jgi:hypothetical protein
MGELEVDVPLRRGRVQGPSDLPRRAGAVPSGNQGAAVPGLRGVAAIRLRPRLRRFTPSGWLPIWVKRDQFNFAVVGRGRCREAVTERMPGIRPEQIGTSKHG